MPSASTTRATSSASLPPGAIRPGSYSAAAPAPLSPRSTSPQALRRTSSTRRGSITTAWWWASISATTARCTGSPPTRQPRRAPSPRTAVADPTIPAVAGEPGATFVFSQILGINDNGLAVGYYGDSTTSQHGYFYNTNTGSYTFLDDPAAAFHDGVEVTQITGITNTGEIAGFYTDANGTFHSFIAVAGARAGDADAARRRPARHRRHHPPAQGRVV